jgi:hypothetical protein
MNIVATTDGERMVQLDGKVDKLDTKMDSVIVQLERVVSSFEKLESTRISKMEERIIILEKWKSEFAGMYKLVGAISLLLGIAALVISFKK